MSRLIRRTVDLHGIRLGVPFPSRRFKLFTDHSAKTFLSSRAHELNAYFASVFDLSMVNPGCLIASPQKSKTVEFLVNASWAIRHWLADDETRPSVPGRNKAPAPPPPPPASKIVTGDNKSNEEFLNHKAEVVVRAYGARAFKRASTGAFGKNGGVGKKINCVTIV